MEATPQVQETPLAEMPLEELARRYAQAQSDSVLVLSKLDIVLAAFKEEHADLFEQEEACKTECARIEAALRAKAVEVYNANPESKRLCFGIGIQVAKSYEYAMSNALQWAKDHDLCLSLDKKAFDAQCKNDSTRPDFVIVKEVPRATIPSDLIDQVNQERKEI